MILRLKRLMAALLMLPLAGCIEVERVELSPKDLVQPEGLEGNWTVSIYDNSKKTSEKIVQIREADDGTFQVLMLNADEDAESLDEHSIGLITPPSADSFIAVIRGQEDGEAILGILVNGEKLAEDFDIGWFLTGMTVNKEGPHEEAAKWMKQHYGLRYKKTLYGATIEGVVNARTLKDVTFTDSRSTKYFKPGSWGARITRTPEDHLYQARLDQALARRARGASATGEGKAHARHAAGRGKREKQPSKADKNLLKAAETGNAGAHLGVVRRNGPVAADTKTAHAWTNTATQQEHQEAQAELAAETGPASGVGSCGIRRCATLDDQTIYRSRVSPHWWYWPDGRIVRRQDWPEE